jgi:hypothetical protein
MSIEVTLEQVTSCLNGKTVWTTVTNYGYRLYTLNMLKSLAPFGLDRSVLILCLDKKSANLFTEKGYHTITAAETNERFCAWNTKGYDRICYLKLEWIFRILSLKMNILLIDGDIVFRKNPIDDLQKWEANDQFDGWIQNDSQDDRNTDNLCTGYIFIRSNSKMIQLYDCVSEEGKLKYQTCAFDNNDQTYFNRFVKPFSCFQPLSLDQYPNGKMYYENTDRINKTAIIVHFNWVHGHIKMANMKRYKMWILTPEEESR